MNHCSLGIEVQGPLGKGASAFTDRQRATLRALLQHLMAVFSIPGENVLRHADITNAYSHKKILWDGKSPSRKVDPAPELWKINRELWSEYQQSLKPKQL